MNDDTRILVNRLVGTPGWDALEAYLNDRRVALLSQLASGHLDQAEYYRTCGEIKGLDAVLTAPSTPDPKRPASRTLTPTRH